MWGDGWAGRTHRGSSSWGWGLSSRTGAPAREGLSPQPAKQGQQGLVQSSGSPVLTTEALPCSLEPQASCQAAWGRARDPVGQEPADQRLQGAGDRAKAQWTPQAWAAVGGRADRLPVLSASSTDAASDGG